MPLNPWKANTKKRQRREAGAHARARIVEFKPAYVTRSGISNERVVCKVTIEFETPGGRAVQSKGKLPILRWNLDKWSTGDYVDIRYDPDDPDNWMCSAPDEDADGAIASGQSAASSGDPGTVFSGVQLMNASGNDPATVIEKLTRVRDQGLITDAQFEAAKLQVGGGSVSAVSQESGVAERLSKLDQLKNQSLISDQEYTEERKRILDSI